MSNDQWGQNQPAPSPWDPQNTNPDATNLPAGDGQPGQNAPASGASAGVPSAGVPSATPPASQASAWEDTGWVPTTPQQQATDPLNQYQQQSSWGQINEPTQQFDPQFGQTQAFDQTQQYGQTQQWDQTQQPYSSAWGQQPGGGPAQPLAPAKKDNFFKTLFDFDFTKYATPAVAKVIFIFVVVLAALTWLLLILVGLISATASDAGGVGVVFALLFGWIPGFVYIVAVRLAIETSIALIRTAENTADIKELLTQEFATRSN